MHLHLRTFFKSVKIKPRLSDERHLYHPVAGTLEHLYDFCLVWSFKIQGVEVV